MLNPTPAENMLMPAQVEMDCNPAQVDVSATVAEAVAKMCHRRANGEEVAQNNSSGASYVLVMDARELMGIITERDVLKLSTNGESLASLLVRDHMTCDPITLDSQNIHNPISVLQILRQHKIQHLPILDQQGLVIGVVTTDKLRQSLRSRDFLQLRRISTVMTRQVVTAAPHEPLLNLVHRMVESQISCVVIVEPLPENPRDQRPIGIITERDVVHMQQQQVDLRQQTAGEMMSHPLICISPEQNLWEAQQQMQQFWIRRLVVVHENRLEGIITQTNMLATLDLAEMYQTITLLQAEVEQLKNEREDFLLHQNQKLEAQVLESERRFEAIFNNTFQFAGLMTPTGILLEANQTALDFGGITQEEVLNRPFWEARWWTLSTATQEQLQQAIHKANQGEFIRYDVEILGQHDRVMWIDFSIRPVKDETGKVILLIPEGRDITELRQAQADLKFHSQLDHLLARLSSRFASTSSQDLSRSINQALQEIGTFLEVDTTYIFQYSDDYEFGDMIYEWVNAGILPQKEACQGLPRTAFPWASDILRRGEILCVPDVATLPEEAKTDRQSWQQAEIKSLLTLPLIENGRTQGSVGFSSIKYQKNWSESVIQTLQFFAEILISALRRHQQQQELRLSDQRFQAIFDNTFQFTGLMQLDGTLIEANQAALDFGGLRRKDVINRPFWETYWWTISPATQSQLKEAIHRAAQGEFIRYEVDVLGAGGRVATIDFSMRPILDELGNVVLIIPEGRDISHLKQVEQDLNFQVGLDRLVAQISSRFIGANESDIAQKIEQAFYKISNYLQIDLSFTTLYDAGRGIENEQILQYERDEQTFAWLNPNLQTQTSSSPNLSCDMFPWILQQIQLGQWLKITQLEDLPISADLDRQMWQANQLQSVLAMPFHNRTHVYGFVIFIDIRESRHWSDNKLQLLKIFTETVTSALHRVQSEQALLSSQIEYQDLVTRIPMAVYKLRSHIDGSFTWDYVSPRWCDLNQLTAEEIQQDPTLPFQLIHPDDIAEMMHQNNEAQAALTMFRWEGRVVVNDQVHWMHVESSPTVVENGEIVWDGLQYEITERIQADQEREQLFAESRLAQAEITKARNNLLTVFERMTDAIVALDRDYNYTYVNQKAEELLGEPASALLGQSLWHKFPEISQSLKQSYRRALDELEVIYIEEYYEPWGRWFANRIYPDAKGITVYFSDITDQKLTELALRDSEKRYANLAEALPIGIFRADRGGKCTYVNELWSQLTGLPATAAYGDGWADSVHPDDRARMIQDWQEFIDGRGEYYHELRLQHVNGEVIWILVESCPEYDANGQHCGYVGGITNITERKQAELSAQISEKRYMSLASAAPVGIFRMDMSGTCLYINDRWSQISGLSFNEANHQGWINGVYPNDRDRVASEWNRCTQAALSFRMEYRFQHPSGFISWVYSQAVAEYSPDGEVIGYVGTITDITDRKQAERALKVTTSRLQEAQQIAHLGSWNYDLQANTMFWSDELYRIFELDSQQSKASYEAFIAVIHPDDRTFADQEYQNSLKNQTSCKITYRLQMPDGRVKYVQEQCQAFYNDEGHPIRSLGVLQDITELQIAQQELKRQRDFNQLIAEIASRFVDIETDNLDAEIERTLQLIGEITESETSYIFKFDDEAHTFSMTHEWLTSSFTPQIDLAQNIPMEVFPWSLPLLRQRQYLSLSSLEDLPPEAATDRIGWQQFGLSAFLCIPIVQSSVVSGFLGFASFSREKEWDIKSLRLLQVMTQVIADTQERISHEQQRFENEERLRLALTAADQGLYDLNIQTGDAIVSPEYARMLEFDPESFQETNAKWIKRLHPDDQDVVGKVYQDYIAGLISDYKVEFRQQTQSGNWKWILSLGKIVARDEDNNPLRMLGTHTDISDRKLAELRLTLQNSVLARIAKADPLPEILEDLARGTEEQLNDGICSILLCDRQGQAHFGAAPNLPASYYRALEGAYIGDKTGSCGTAAFRKESVIVADIATDPLWEDYAELALAHGLRACWSIPVIDSENTVLATFGVYYPEIHHPDQYEMEAVRWVVDITKIAIESEQARQALHQLNQDLEAQVTARTGELQVRERQLRDLFNNATDLIQSVAPNGQILFVNQAWLKTLGYSQGEIDQLSIFDVVHPEEQEHCRQMMQELFAGKTFEGFETRFVSKTGDVIRLEGNINSRTQEGGPLASRGIFRDVTQRKLAEDKLRKSDAHLKSAQRVAQLGSWEFDFKSEHIAWSEEVFRIFGVDPAEGPPSNFEDLQMFFHPDDRELHAGLVQQALATGQSYDQEFRIYRPDGTLVYIQAKGVIISDDRGQPQQIMGTSMDITDRKLAEQKIQQTVAQLEATNHELESFSYSVSHDLRAPLRHIHGFVNALRNRLVKNDALTDPKVVQYLGTIEGSSKKMAVLIDNLLSLSRIGRKPMTTNPTDVRPLVDEAIALATSETKATHSVEFIIGDLPTVQADANLLQQVFSNLINNAVKFSRNTPNPKITIGTTTEGAIFIQDNGVGFNMKYSDKLFGAFQRLHAQTEFEGTGIGLAIVQRIIHRHGGHIWAESKINQGTTFYFTIGNDMT